MYRITALSFFEPVHCMTLNYMCPVAEGRRHVASMSLEFVDTYRTKAATESLTQFDYVTARVS